MDKELQYTTYNIEELIEKAEKDTNIKLQDLTHYSVLLPKTTISWFRILSEVQRDFHQIDRIVSKANKKAIKHYKFDYPLSLNATEVKEFINADDDLSKAKDTYNMVKTQIEFVEGVIKTLNSSSFNVKNAIEYEKFKQGLN